MKTDKQAIEEVIRLLNFGETNAYKDLLQVQKPKASKKINRHD